MRSLIITTGLAVAVLGVVLSISSCNVDSYCIDCFDAQGTGPVSDADPGTIFDADLVNDASDLDACVSSGLEQCDGLDNDCDGTVDETTNDLPGVGITCGNEVGECTGGTTLCQDGSIVCGAGAVNPTFEACNNLDDDCDGNVDENNPEGGLICGTNQGECIAGVQQCTAGVLSCVGETTGGTEICNGFDDDCDGLFDEGITLSGNCGPTSDNGVCTFGVNTCVGGSIQCVGAVLPKLEECDMTDHDCDGNNLNGFNLTTDPNNCTACGNQCAGFNAFWTCNNGCEVAACETDFHDLNGLANDGCEFGPCTFAGNEICNGVDDDCDGLIDEGVNASPPDICDQDGECSGTVATCDSVAGQFVCPYGATVSTDVAGAIISEVDCDERDNDCDGRVDEAFVTKGNVCDDGELGSCRDTGVVACNATDDGVLCTAIDNPADNPPPAESCNNLDDDCDGLIDEGDVQEWVTIGGGVEIFKYEASRPDSNAVDQGFVIDASVCSDVSRVPWTNITQPQAEAACQGIGARLCSEAEWQLGCESVKAPAGNVQQGSNNMIVIEGESGTAVNTGWVVDNAVAGFTGTGYMQVPDNTETDVFDPGNLDGNSPRVDYTINFTQTGTHFLWVRMYADTNQGDDSAWFAFDDTNGNLAGGQGASPYLDLDTNRSWDWMGQFDNESGRISFTVGTAGNHTISIYNGEDGVIIDKLVITTDANFVPINDGPPEACEFSYQSDCKVYQPNTCVGDDLDGDPVAVGNQSLMLPTGSQNACFADWEVTAGDGNTPFDMSGNIKEWGAERAPGINPLRGGSFNNTATGISCQFDFLTADDAFFLPNIGFRCCR